MTHRFAERSRKILGTERETRVKQLSTASLKYKYIQLLCTAKIYLRSSFYSRSSQHQSKSDMNGGTSHNRPHLKTQTRTNNVDTYGREKSKDLLVTESIQD